MKKMITVLLALVVASVTPAVFSSVFAGEDWRQAVIGTWSGVPDRLGPTARVLTITAIHEDGRVEGTFWGPILASAPGLPLSPESRSTFQGKAVELSLKVRGGFDVDLELTYNVKRKSLSGDYIPRASSAIGISFYTFFTKEK